MWKVIAPAVAATAKAARPMPARGMPAAPAPAMARPAVAAPPAPQPGAHPAAPHHGGSKNVIGETLRDRAKHLTPQDSQTFAAGISVPALIVLKKVLPELSPAIDQLIAKKGGAPGAPAAGAPPAVTAPMPAAMPAPAAPMQQPGSGLRRV